MPDPRPRTGSATARGALCSLASAALFGASAPAAKALLPGAGPLAVAGWLYVAGGLGLVALAAVAPGWRGHREAALTRADVPRLAGIVLVGGVAAPALLLAGLERVRGVVGSLLLNLEAPLTVLLAVAAFGEHVGRRGVVGVLAVTAGAVALTAGPGAGAADPLGAAAVAAACALWALDNNWTQGLSGKDPVAITRAKCVVAGATNLALAAAVGDAFPGPTAAAALAGVGFLAYGVGLVLATLGMRALGAARHAALFASAPFVGALASWPVLGERPSAADLGAAALLAGGIAALLTDRHEHAHAHEACEHDHRHVHDEHHDHAHGPGDPPGEPHAHVHVHAPRVHTHAHVSDLHHRHGHPR